MQTFDELIVDLENEYYYFEYSASEYGTENTVFKNGKFKILKSEVKCFSSHSFDKFVESLEKRIKEALENNGGEWGVFVKRIKD